MLKTKIKSAFIALAIAFQAFAPVALADFLNVRAYSTDTVAGYAALLRSSVLTPEKDVIFVVEKPDYSVVRVTAQADLEGIAKADLYGHQTKMVGDYKVALYYPGSPTASPQSVFKVYPDQVSKTQSIVSSTSQMVEADGLTKTFVTVTLYDAYRNPIKDHSVKLISSRTEDDVQAIKAGISDSDGRVSFIVTSKYTGISVFTAVDSSANSVLTDREEIVFYAPNEPIGGNYFSTKMLQADIINDALAQEVLPGPVHHFEIEDLSSTVKVNVDQTLTIVAKDKDNNVAKNYTGSILISTPDDENAVLPNNGEYTFKEADQGQFTFNLALRFTQVGNQFIQVLDKNDWKIAGEKEIEVIPQQAITIPDASASLAIKSPLDGAEFGSNLVIISGQGDPNINLKIFDNDVKIGDSETDSDGFFTYQASNLAPGNHTFYVMSDAGDVSRSVSVTVDTLPPVLNSIQVSPDGVVMPGTSLNIVVNSEPNLDEVKIRIQGIEKDLLPQPGQPGSYSVVVTAPVLNGSFPIDVVLVDDLSNRAEFRGQKTVLVEDQAAVLPSVVQNLEGIAGDSEIVLTWNKVEGHDTAISYYKVNYGTSHTNLNEILETVDNVGSLKIPDLTNGVQYFFAVTAIDARGNESEEMSVIIAVTPINEEEPLSDMSDEDGLFPSASEGAETPIETPSETQPFMPQASLYNNPLIGSASSNTVTLTWQAFPGINAAYYKVYFGLTSSSYDDYMLTRDNTPSLVVKDLINNIPYYFAVIALDYSGNEISPLSAEFMMTPSGAGFQSLPADQVITSRPSYNPPLDNDQFSKVPFQEETGPATTILVIISLTLAGTFFYFNKRRLLRR